MNSFFMNGYLWHIVYVRPESGLLMDRTGKKRVATTDPHTRCVYIANDLDDEFLATVLIHELGHCVMFSYGILEEIHSFVLPEHWVEAEEWVCNFIADYGREVFQIARMILGDETLISIPRMRRYFVA